MKYYNNIMETVGNTPLVRLNSVVKGCKDNLVEKKETIEVGYL